MPGKENMPLVSIVFPLYNEGRFIRETLESITQQDYENIEIIISDNASTDNTADVCREFAEKDPRIIFIQQETNIGPARNAFIIARMAKGKYYMMGAGHDKWSANLIGQSVRALEERPSATVAFPTSVWIDENGERMNKHSGWYDTRGLDPVARFFNVFWGTMNPIVGVMRLDKVPKRKEPYNFVGGDLVMLSNLALEGEFIHITDAFFYRRQNRPTESFQQRMNRFKSKQVKLTSSSFYKLFPLAKLPFELTKTILNSNTRFIHKFFLLLILIPAMPARYFLGKK